jgi:hypothetical protein
MVDNKDFIVKNYYSKSGEYKPQKWYMQYCNMCGTKRSYLPKDRDGNCLSCSCRGRTISQKQRESISKTLTGKPRGKINDLVSWKRKIGKANAIVASKRSKEQTLSMSNRGAATRLGLSLEEYLSKKIELSKQRKMFTAMRTHINQYLKSKIGSMRHVNYSGEELKKHLESRFKDNMSWENYGKGANTWQVDHIIPLKFKKENNEYFWNQDELCNPETNTFKMAWSLNNLRPEWSDLNNRRNANIDEEGLTLTKVLK